MESIIDQSTGNQTIKARGGARIGAGRKPLNTDPRSLAARFPSLTPLQANVILRTLIDERRAWMRVFDSPDERVILDALKFLVSMRDGKPAQQINVTSLGVTVTVDEIEKARAIVREITGMHAPLEQPREGSTDVRRESLAKPLMLSGDGGEQKGG